MRLGNMLPARNLAIPLVFVLLGGVFGHMPLALADPVFPVLNPADFNSPTGIQVIGQTSNSPILEHEQAHMTFTVKNNSTHFVILDEAELIIELPSVPDPSDRPFNPINVTFSPFIAPGGIGVYDYTASTFSLDFGDYGISPITFQIYMSEIAGPPSSLPAVVNTLVPCPAPAQAVGCTALTFFEPFLQPPFLVGPQHEADNFADPLMFRVNDAPEPPMLGLIGIGCLGMFGARRRRSPAAQH